MHDDPVFAPLSRGGTHPGCAAAVGVRYGCWMVSGSFAALVTLFSADGEVDVAETRAHVDRLAEAGCDGVLVCGTSSEFPALDEHERVVIAEAAIDAAAGRMTVAVHVGSPSTRMTRRLARAAVAAGADMLAAVTPYYLRTDTDGLRAYLEAIRGVAPDTPLLAYSIAKMTGYEYPVDLLAELAAGDVVQGVKESGEELGRLIALRQACGERFVIFAGSPHLQAACFAHSADGAILGIANVAPAECLTVARLAASGDHGGAAMIVQRLAPLAGVLAVGTPLAALKEAMTQRFGTSPVVRAPRHRLDEPQRARVRDALAASGLSAPVPASG
jgi:dihydrodipicolinate synthase/N-acetylneuraminate lyase